jgi:uncharacterized protein
VAANYHSDIIIVGGGLAGLAAAYDLLGFGKKVLVIERDLRENLGGLAKKSFGGIMFVGSPEQRRLHIQDSPDLAWSDWQSYAEFENDDVLPREWAKFYVENSIEFIYDWLKKKKVTFLPITNWTERGLDRRGNSVPRWHITWGTGFAIVEAVLKSLGAHPARANLQMLFSHRVEELDEQGGQIIGVAGRREDTGEEFTAHAGTVVLASGGICGGDLGKVRQYWNKELGSPPNVLLNGSHRYADGLMLDTVSRHGGKLTHLDRHWHYAAGVYHPAPKQANDGLSLVPPRSALWLDASGRRFGPMPLVSYTDTKYLVERICRSPGQYSWQVLNWKIAIKELAVSGSDYMTAIRNKQRLRFLSQILLGNKALVKRLLDESDDFVSAGSLSELADKMEKLSQPGFKIDREGFVKDIREYDAQIEAGEGHFSDEQLKMIVNFRKYRGDRIRLCKYQKIDDPKAYPLIAIREFILSRKSLGGIQTDMKSRVLNDTGSTMPGLYAVGEAAGFGGGGIHGRRSLEGTFLGSCILTGRVAAEAIAKG